MSLQIGSRLGPYEITGSIGAGGMGEVYRARDARLERDVAIKVLPASFAADAGRLRRFEQEARATSALNHPSILTIYDIGSHEGAPYIVAELLEGEALRAALREGALPVRRALDYAQQIARGLAAAHEKGIVHRDLKPDNLFVTPDGRVKILDFGLAKLRPQAHEPLDSGLATEQAPTGPGVVLGTVGYMAPEQVRGREADPRADIFSFGVILHEMLSGRRTFTGESSIEVLNAILKEEPGDLGETNPKVSPQLDRVVRRCLEKKPEARFHSAHDLGFALEALQAPSGASGSRAIATGSGQQAPGRSAGGRERIAWIVAAVALMAALAALRAAYATRSAADTRVVRLAFLPPDNVAFDATQADHLVVSPNGRMLVFTGRSADGKRQLWVRPLDSSEARALPGTDDAIEPFWSPDSRSLGFGAQGKLKRIELAGGRPQLLADAPRLVGGTWSRAGVILFVPDFGTGVSQVSTQGGEAKPVTKTGRSPFFLPNGRHFLYTGTGAAGTEVFLGSLDTGETKVLASGAAARYAPPGFLLFARDGALVAQAFDASRLALSGDPVTIPTAQTSLGDGGIPFSVSENGVLVWQRNLHRAYQLAWFDRAGKPLGAVGSPASVTQGQAPSLSPDGSRVVVEERRSDSPRPSILAIDLLRGVPTRLSSRGQLATWSPDGARVAWQGTGKDGVVGLFQRVANGVAAEQLLLEGTKYPNDWSPDGRFILYTTRGEKTRLDIWALPLVGSREPHPVIATEFDESQAQLSPDGRFIAYRSDVSGGFEIYVQAFDGEGKVGSERWRLSTSGGSFPRFRPDGRELTYLADDGQLMAVAIQAKAAAFDYRPPKALFQPRMLPRGAQAWFEYDVARDGRFLIGTVVDTPNPPPPSAVVVLNWSAELEPRKNEP